MDTKRFYENHIAAVRRWQAKNPERVQAYSRAKSALARRNFVIALGYKGGACEDCGSTDFGELGLFPTPWNELRFRDLQRVFRIVDRVAIVCTVCRRGRRAALSAH